MEGRGAGRHWREQRREEDAVEEDGVLASGRWGEEGGGGNEYDLWGPQVVVCVEYEI
jgi:hypothetical protein